MFVVGFVVVVLRLVRFVLLVFLLLIYRFELFFLNTFFKLLNLGVNS